MGLDTVLQGIGGALKGGLDAYSWQQEYAQKDRELAQRKDVETLKLEIRTMLAELAEKGRNDRAELSSDTTRRGQDLTASTAADRNATTQRGQDLNFNLGMTRDTTTRRGQDLDFRTGEMRDATTRRGQDVGASTQRRGQDLTFKSAEMRDFTDRRGQDMNAATAAAGQKSREDIARIRGPVVNFYSGSTPVTPSQPAPGRTPVTPPATSAAPAGAAPDFSKMTNDALIAEAQKQIDATSDPKKKAELQARLDALRKRGGGR